MQEEWDAIPLETSARASAAAAPTSDTPPAVSTISYDDALASLAAADMSAAVPRVVLYEAPASCFGRLLHCFGRPSLHIQNADEELQLPFLLALTPYDGCPPPPHTCLYSAEPLRSSNPTHLCMLTTFYSKITAESRPVDRVGRCSGSGGCSGVV